MVELSCQSSQRASRQIAGWVNYHMCTSTPGERCSTQKQPQMVYTRLCNKHNPAVQKKPSALASNHQSNRVEGQGPSVALRALQCHTGGDNSYFSSQERHATRSSPTRKTVSNACQAPKRPLPYQHARQSELVARTYKEQACRVAHAPTANKTRHTTNQTPLTTWGQ